MEDTYLSPSNDPAGKSYDSHSTLSFRPKVSPKDCASNIGSSVSEAWALPTFAQGKPQQFLGQMVRSSRWRERLRRSWRGTYFHVSGELGKESLPHCSGGLCDWMPWRVATYLGSGSPQGHTADGPSRSRALAREGKRPCSSHSCCYNHRHYLGGRHHLQLCHHHHHPLHPVITVPIINTTPVTIITTQTARTTITASTSGSLPL